MILLRSVRALGRPLAFGLLICACAASSEPGEPTKAAERKDQSAEARSAANETALPAAEQLLADSVEAMGGAEKFAALTSYYAETQVSMVKLGLTGVAKMWWRGGDFYSEMEMPGVGSMRNGSLGGKPWGDDPINGVRVLGGKEAEQAMWSTTLCLAHEWRRHFKTAETTAVVQVDGRQVAEITLTSALGDQVVLRLDMASKLPVSQRFTQASPLGDTPVLTSFDDFRVVEGLKLSFKQELDASLTNAVVTMTRLELNAAVDASRFAMPMPAVAVTPGALVDGARIDPERVAEATAAAAAAAEKAEKAAKRRPGKG